MFSFISLGLCGVEDFKGLWKAFDDICFPRILRVFIVKGPLQTFEWENRFSVF